jgi:hypothetical protein
VELVSVAEPLSYVTRLTLPDVVSITTVSTEPHADGTVVRTVVVVRTRPVNWLVRAVVSSGRTSRQLEANEFAELTRQALEDFYARRAR